MLRGLLFHEQQVVASAKHAELARTLAQRGIVMLRNDNNTLPLSLAQLTVANGPTATTTTTSAIAVIGPNANRTSALLSSYAGCRETWGGEITPACDLVTPLRGIQEAVQAAATTTDTADVAVTFVEGCRLNHTIPGGAAAAAAAVKAARVAVVVLGLSTNGDGNDGVVFEAEAHDRTTLDLPAVQVDLLSSVCAAAEEAGTRVVVVLMNGGPISAYSAATGACVHALVEAWYPGQAGGSALADLLFGVASPSGRLPVTVPVGDAQLADNYYDLSLTAGPHGRTYVRPLSCR